MLLNSFSSVSLDPPLVLFSLPRRLYILSALRSPRPWTNKWEDAEVETILS
jgi:hypothetical protein